MSKSHHPMPVAAAAVDDREWPFPLAMTSSTHEVCGAREVRGLGVVLGFGMRSTSAGGAQAAHDDALRGAMLSAAARGANALVGIRYQTNVIALQGEQTSLFFAGSTAQHTVLEVVAYGTAVQVTNI